MEENDPGRDHRCAGEIHLHVTQTLFAVLHRSEALIDRAIAIALYLRHPIYDCLYLVCAERAGTRLVTADWKFLAALAGTSLASLAVHMDAFTDG